MIDRLEIEFDENIFIRRELIVIGNRFYKSLSTGIAVVVVVVHFFFLHLRIRRKNIFRA
jgi:hypothetical protein